MASTTPAPTPEPGPWVVRDPAAEPPAAPAPLAEAVAQVRAAQPADPASEAARRRLLDLAADHPDLLLRTCRPGHLTGSALVVEEGVGRVLVLWHRKLQRWLQPGGHADGDGDLARVAWREATEETGVAGLRVLTPAVHVDVHEVRPPDDGPHLHLDLRFAVLAPRGSVPRANHESEAIRWVDPADLPSLDVDPGTLAMATAGLAAAARVGAVPAPTRPGH